jgi:hypothetical protein
MDVPRAKRWQKIVAEEKEEIGRKEDERKENE